MGLEIGIVGLPNVGKSTLFQAITAISAEAANYPFCTIEPNVALVNVPDPRMEVLRELFEPQAIIFNALKMVDIAGLVRKASQGEGLGNQFLEHIRQADIYIHLVRCFQDENIVHVEGNVDPIRDIEIIRTELILADLDKLQKSTEKLAKEVKKNKDLKDKWEFYNELINYLDQEKLIISQNFSAEKQNYIKELGLITSKPFFYVINVSDKNYAEDQNLRQQVYQLAQQDNVKIFEINCSLEAELAQLELKDKKSFMEELGLKTSGLDLIIREGFQLLNQITFFTAGKKEVRAWNTHKGSLAPEAAGKIHSDMQKGFIRAEVYHLRDIEELKSEANIQKQGRFRLEGKDYIVQDGDILYIRFNV